MSHSHPRLTPYVLLLACSGWFASPVFAQCDFDALTKTRPMSISMVRNYAACVSPDTYYEDNPVAAMQACGTVALADNGRGVTNYDFDPAGGCTVKFKPGIVDDCSTIEDLQGYAPPPGPCEVTEIRAKCWGIERAGIPIVAWADDGWSLRASFRLTVNHPDRGDMTVVDPPYPGGPAPVGHTSPVVDFDWWFDYPRNGSIEMKSTTMAAYVWSAYPFGASALPTCTTVQIIGLEVLDPAERSFATIGFSTRASAD